MYPNLYRKVRAGLYSFNGGTIEKLARVWYTFIDAPDGKVKRCLGPYKTLGEAGLKLWQDNDGRRLLAQR